MWKQGKKWVYSITYDEGCQALLEHALPLHREFGIPGHVALVATQVGVPRNCPGSDYNGMMILNRMELESLAREGWGLSCHSMTHASITPENACHEVAEARQVLEEKLERQVSIFCVPGNNESYPAARAVAAAAGYRAIMTLTDMVNLPETMGCIHPFGAVPAQFSSAPPETGLLNLGRTALHSQYPPPFYSAFDPYRRLHQAIDRGGWVIDYAHCPMPGKPIHPWKDCTTEELAERFAAVKRLGGDDVWLAEPGEVVEYLVNISVV